MLTEAHRIAADVSLEVPAHWVEVADVIGHSPSKTFVAGLGAALLAKSTNSKVDPLSIKEAYSDRAFSLRTICHTVLVPHSRQSDPPYHLGATGREPLNNQPYFRYDHLDTIDRLSSSAKPYLNRLKAELTIADTLTADEAVLALAAFLRQRIAVQTEINQAEGRYVPGAESLVALRDALETYLAPGREQRPARLQAVVGGLISCVVADETSVKRLNDPSRDAPGDVNVPETDPYFSAEVRGKAVPQHDAHAFVRECGRSGIGTAWIVALADDHVPIDRAALLDVGYEGGVLPVVIESVDELVTAVLGGPAQAQQSVLREIGPAVTRMLRATEVDSSMIDEWADLLRPIS